MLIDVYCVIVIISDAEHWGAVIRRLSRGLATLPKVNRSLYWWRRGWKTSSWASQIVTTNKPTSSFFTRRCPSCRPKDSAKAETRKVSHSTDFLPGSAGRLSSSSSPLKAPVDLGEGCQASGQPSDDSTPMYSITAYRITTPTISTVNANWLQTDWQTDYSNEYLSQLPHKCFLQKQFYHEYFLRNTPQENFTHKHPYTTISYRD